MSSTFIVDPKDPSPGPLVPELPVISQVLDITSLDANAGQPAPGLYVLPYYLDGKECSSEEAQARFREGPVGKLTLRRPGAMSVGPMLLQWFALNLAVAFVAACMALGAMSPHHAAHVAGLATLLAYGAGAVSEAIWMGKPWAATLKDLLDALIYALATAAVFMWFWPR